MLYLSTNSNQDLSVYNSGFIGFERLGKDEPEVTEFLKHPWNWLAVAPEACSCGFRHLCDGDLDFSEPQDWYPEEDDDVRATTELYRVIADLVSAGHQVECLDTWNGTLQADVKTRRVDLTVVSERMFRLFENQRFVFEQGTQEVC